MADGRLMQTILLDFYGELLTDKQRECCDLHYNDDLSLSEIAEQSGISRQGVWDNIRRAEASLNEFEEKTGLVKRFNEIRKVLESVSEKLEVISLQGGEAKAAADEALREIKALNLKG